MKIPKGVIKSKKWATISIFAFIAMIFGGVIFLRGAFYGLIIMVISDIVILITAIIQRKAKKAEIKDE
jgi:hypothetical protein